MKITKIPYPRPDNNGYAVSPGKVQGAVVAKKRDDLLVISPRRFKLHTDRKELLYILEGAGHIKWARGEIPFEKDDCFLADDCGEYEVNGNASFLVIRSFEEDLPV